jgi:hypothetical protein
MAALSAESSGNQRPLARMSAIVSFEQKEAPWGPPARGEFNKITSLAQLEMRQ